jgi:hypothetical protein
MLDGIAYQTRLPSTTEGRVVSVGYQRKGAYLTMVHLNTRPSAISSQKTKVVSPFEKTILTKVESQKKVSQDECTPSRP